MEKNLIIILSTLVVIDLVIIILLSKMIDTKDRIILVLRKKVFMKSIKIREQSNKKSYDIIEGS